MSSKEEKDSLKNQSHLSGNLEWGNHNARLTDQNFVERIGKKKGEEKEFSSLSNNAIDLGKQEPDRNKKGIKEGKNKLGEDKNSID